MRFIDTRVSEYLRENAGCAHCEYRLSCMGGCRAAALEASTDNIFAADPITCEIFRGGWLEKLEETVNNARRAGDKTDG